MKVCRVGIVGTPTRHRRQVQASSEARAMEVALLMLGTPAWPSIEPWRRRLMRYADAGPVDELVAGIVEEGTLQERIFKMRQALRKGWTLERSADPGPGDQGVWCVIGGAPSGSTT